MKIILPSPRGFCAGVDMAIESLDRALELYGSPLYAFHQIVHNTHVVASFETRGVIFVDDLLEVPVGATVVFSAHGVAPPVREQAVERSLRVIDATCPLVTKVHSEAKRYADKGFTVVFIGHRGHDEAVGVMGEMGGMGTLVESISDVEALIVPDPNKVAYLTQTTLGVTETAEIIQSLKKRYPEIRGPSKKDICYATENRQAAVGSAASEADLVLVVGSANSSNSNRLVDEARRVGREAHLIDGPEDIDGAWLGGVETAVVTAGASVPEPVVESVLDWLMARYECEVEERVTAVETVAFRLPPLVRGEL